jgi:hypothetical protein
MSLILLSAKSAKQKRQFLTAKKDRQSGQAVYAFCAWLSSIFLRAEMLLE